MVLGTIFMKKYIELREQKVEYVLRRSARAKRIRFAIYGGGEFVVTVPRKFSELDLERFMRQKADWILEKTQEFKNFKKPSENCSQNLISYSATLSVRLNFLAIA